MKKVFSIFFVFSLLLSPMVTFCQVGIDETNPTDSVYTTTNRRLFRNYELFSFDWRQHPSITIFSGFNYPTYSKISSASNFNTQNFATIHLGMTKIKPKVTENGDKVQKIDKKSIFLGNFSSKWKVQSNDNIDAKMWRFGIELNDDGYGYKIGRNNFIFFTYGTSLIWSKFDVEKLSTFPQPDSTLLGVFSSQFRFGNSYHSGISLVFLNSLSFDFRFERAIVFPGHKFWYWLGSSLIEGASQALLGEFIDEIIKSSPQAAPLVNVILKGALSYGIYELRKDKMNWPFKTEPPLFNDNFKIGLSFLF